MEKKRRTSYSDSFPMSRMNELPDDVLVIILSKLTMKEAARTSVLSHRWENLWVYYAGSLNFQLVDANPLDVSLSIRQLPFERPKLTSWVNHVLNSHRGSKVDKFRVCFDLDENNGDDIERWIKFAIEKTVSRFELDFSLLNEFYVKWCDCYQFPSKLLDSPNNLLRPFGSLTSLRLISVDLSNEVLAYFISNCLSLEHLSIKGASSLTYLNATTALKLKYLEIEYCPGLKNVDISNTNIESLKFTSGWETNLSLEELHLLSEVSLDGQWCPSVVWSRFEPLPISQLQRLEIDLCDSFHMGNIKFAEVFPTFSTLKHLKVSVMADHDQNIFCLTSLVCASPLLNSFTLKVLYVEPTTFMRFCELPNCEWRKTEKRVHDCLKVVEFIGWYGYKCDFDIVRYLIGKSVVLKKLIIDPRLLYNGKRLTLDENKETAARDRAKLLQHYVPPGMELVIL